VARNGCKKLFKMYLSRTFNAINLAQKWCNFFGLYTFLYQI
jgi:hypothetical protein